MGLEVGLGMGTALSRGCAEALSAVLSHQVVQWRSPAPCRAALHVPGLHSAGTGLCCSYSSLPSAARTQRPSATAGRRLPSAVRSELEFAVGSQLRAHRCASLTVLRVLQDGAADQRAKLCVCGNGWKSAAQSRFNQRNGAAVGVNGPCTKADVLISFAEEVHCDSLCASLLLSV